MSKSKAKGTRAETKIMSALRAVGIDCRRQTLQGRADVGDIYISLPAGADLILEVKCGAQTEKYTRAQKMEWLAQTERERINAGVAEAWLVIVGYRKAFSAAEVWSSDGHEFWFLDEFIENLKLIAR